MLDYFILITLIISLLFDLTIGELPTKIHPVVLVGSLIDYLKSKLIKYNSKKSGFYLTLIVYFISISILLTILYLSTFNIFVYIIIYSIILSSTFSCKMLITSAGQIKKELDENINIARNSLSYLVSRNTDELSEEFIVSATIETLTENITDSYIAPLFYFILFSYILPYQYLIMIPFIYRISNTLDAMLGYETDELKNIGFVPAKLDDILNYIPSRMGGILMVFSSFIIRYDYKNAYKIMIRDARNCPSPNSGYTMATCAGALDIQLVKKGTYILGDDNKIINKDDISKAIRLSSLLMFIFTFIILVCVII